MPAALISAASFRRQLFNYLIHTREKDDWAIEDFVKRLCERADASGVNGDFRMGSEIVFTENRYEKGAVVVGAVGGLESNAQ